MAKLGKGTPSVWSSTFFAKQYGLSHNTLNATTKREDKLQSYLKSSNRKAIKIRI